MSHVKEQGTSHVKEQGTPEQGRILEAAGWMWARSGGWMAPTPDNKFDGKFWSAAGRVETGGGK